MNYTDVMKCRQESVRVQFEIGHEASVRTKKTPEGFTHDWEVFVRGADNTDIQWFVDKVVFHLHETFPKPRRVIKEPPYVVKESGYAGFVLPIDVYLKNKEEPKKISFQYDLTLQSSGPPISRVLREPRLFQNPSEDFRRKLIRGGGVGVDTPSEPSADDLKSAPSIPQNKSKLVESPAKKHKSDQPLNHSFAELFGTPIRRVPEQKKLPEPSKKVEEKKKSSKPYKDEKEASKEKYSDRDKSKEKIKRPASPSPSLPPPPAPQVKSKDEHKKHEEKEKKKEEDKKKRKEEKDKKEKAKEPERQADKEHKKDKKESRDGDYAKKLNSKPPDARPNYEKHNNEALDKEKERLEKEKHKHRHKKKEKEKNRDKEKHRKEKEKDVRDREKEKSSKKKHEEPGREKEEKRRKSRSPSPVQVKKGPLNALLDELGSSDSASPLSEDETIPAVKPLPKPPAKPVPEIKPQPILAAPSKPKSTNSNEPTPKLDEANSNKNKKEKSSSKKSKKSDKEFEKKKEKEEHRVRSPSSERAEREEEEEKERTSKEERVEKERLDEDKPKPRDKESRKRKREKSEEKQTKSKKNEGSQSGAVDGSDGTTEELRRPDKFTKEYVAQLRDLQRRIMTLEDNAELQKVVKVIAETGQYEVTKKTFDFDLCALDMETVKRLQEFFAPT